MRLCIQCRWCRHDLYNVYRCDLQRLACFFAEQQGCGEWRKRETELKGDREHGTKLQGLRFDKQLGQKS